MLDYWAIFRGAVLLLAIWPGPRPVLHSHDQYLEQPGGTGFLARHSALHHSYSSVPETVPSGPHCHWLFTGLVCDNALLGNPGQVAPSQADAVDFDSGRLVLGLILADCPSVDSPKAWKHPSDRTPSQEAQHLSGLALCQLFCSWIC